jgi:exodeoxyribonuclease V beta subunit
MADLTFDSSPHISNSTEPLDVNTLPLSGVRLIEASAGTGKTYTITSLYLRLIIGHQCKALSPENILVVTFTRAATEELRDRIRGRLKQALADFSNTQSNDPVIEMIRSQLDQEKIQAAKQRLKDALQLMDLAAIYTIHGFAQKLLRQHAVEANVSGDFELIINEADILIQAVQDVWRSSIYPLKGETLSLIINQWNSPETLLKQTRNLLYRDVDFHLGETPGDFETAAKNYNSAKDQLQEQWQVNGEYFINEIKSNKDLNGTFGKGIGTKINNIELFFAGQKVTSKDLLTALNSFTHAGLVKSIKKNGDPINHSLSDYFQKVSDYHEPYHKAKDYELRIWRISLTKKIKQRLMLLKERKLIVATDDLLTNLNYALDKHEDSQLADPIRKQYPVAMVDEFQDTDAAQYALFRKLYVNTSSDQSGFIDKESLALFMIGDPKQAIYKFRGADIFTYIKAKNEVTKGYNLDTNYRSTEGMVRAVNTIFTQHNKPFIYDNDIPFISVKAKDNADRLKINGQQQKALSWKYINTDQKEISSASALVEELAQDCAEQISVLLNTSDQGGAVLANNENQLEKLKAKDIAVLVRSGRQAQIVKNALTQRGVGCVYVGQDNVFESAEAQGLLMLLQAVHGLSERKYRNAIAHPIWQLSLAELQQCFDNEEKWEQQLEQLYSAHNTWTKQGIMPMIMTWLHHRQLPQAWLTNTDGERILTNMMHLAELLQETTSDVQGMQGLMTWFDQQVTGSLLGDGDQKQLRLESDSNLVQIVTVHKSKGLEYPIVFLPYCWNGTESKDEIFFDQDADQLMCDLAGDFKPARIQEGLAEEVRLLYVGLTRAATKCYVSIPTLPIAKGSHLLNKSIMDSALKYVLFGDLGKSEVPNIWDYLSALDSDVFSNDPVLDSITVINQTTTESALSARKYTGRIKRDWQLSSFSSLVRHHHAPHTVRFNLDDDGVNNNSDNIDDTVDKLVEDQFSFPKGAHAGNFLHTLLENVDFTCLPENMDQQVLDKLVIELLTRFGIEQKWLAVTKQWLTVILTSPLSHPGLSLTKLTDDLKQVEMEFYFPISKLSSVDFNRLLNQYSVLDCPVNDVDFRTIKGMMKGFIDLTFCWDDQYFILDYKSNHLGHEFSDYQFEKLELAMADHRYDIQLVLYTLALHRLLRLRLSNYDYDQHIGGGYYLFLRGLNLDNNLGQFFHKPERGLIEALDELISAEVKKDPVIEIAKTSGNYQDQLERGQMGFEL